MRRTEFVFPKLTNRQLVQATLAVLLVAAAFYFLYRFQQVFLIFFVAIVLSTAIQPLVQRLAKVGIPVPIGVVTVYLVLVAGVAAVILLLAPLVVDQGNQLLDTVPETYQDVRERMLEHPNFFIWRLASESPESISLGPNPASSEGERDVIERVEQNLALIGLGGKSIFLFLATLLLAFYWTLDSQKNITAILLLVPFERRESAREIVSEIQARLAAFIQGQTLLGLVIGVLSFGAYLLIGLPYTLALAIVAGLMELVPVIGPLLGAIPAIIVAYSIEPSKVIWVLVATAVIQQLENNLLVPRVMKRSVGVNPFVTLLALTAFGSLFGFLGAVVAIPLAAIIQLLLNRFVVETAVPDESAIEGRDRASVLRYEVQELTRDIRKAIREKDITPDEVADEVEDTIEAIAADLESVLAGSQMEPEESSPEEGDRP